MREASRAPATILTMLQEPQLDQNLSQVVEDEILAEGNANPTQESENEDPVPNDSSGTRAPNWAWDHKYRFIQLVASKGHGKWMAVAEQLEEECKIPVVEKMKKEPNYLRKCFNTLSGKTSLLRQPFKPRKPPLTKGKTRQEVKKIMEEHVEHEKERNEQFQEAQKLMKKILGLIQQINSGLVNF